MLTYADTSLVARWRDLDTREVAIVRDRALDRLRSVGLTEDTDDARLLLGELLANAVRHAYGPGAVLVWARGSASAVVEVHDSSPVLPDLPSPRAPGEVGADATCGWGLPLVSDLTRQRCGVVPLPQGGKAVWASLSLRSGGQRSRMFIAGLVRAQIRMRGARLSTTAHWRPGPGAAAAR